MERCLTGEWRWLKLLLSRRLNAYRTRTSSEFFSGDLAVQISYSESRTHGLSETRPCRKDGGGSGRKHWNRTNVGAGIGAGWSGRCFERPAHRIRQLAR